MMGFLRGQMNNPSHQLTGRCGWNPRNTRYLCVPFSRDARYRLGTENRTWEQRPWLSSGAAGQARKGGCGERVQRMRVGEQARALGTHRWACDWWGRETTPSTAPAEGSWQRRQGFLRIPTDGGKAPTPQKSPSPTGLPADNELLQMSPVSGLRKVLSPSRSFGSYQCT